MCLGIPGQIVEITDEQARMAIVDVGGVRRSICVAFIVNDRHPVASCLGNWVLVHVGFAMVRIDEAEAAATLALLREMGEYEAELDSMRSSAA